MWWGVIISHRRVILKLLLLQSHLLLCNIDNGERHSLSCMIQLLNWSSVIVDILLLIIYTAKRIGIACLIEGAIVDRSESLGNERIM